MKRLNNRGFAISTILFSILILGTLVFGILYSTTITTKECKNGCCEPPCVLPEENTCSDFQDFSCPGEFTIGTEHFCVLKTYENSDTSINDKVVVALAKYYVNANESKNDISPYGLQYKYAICEEMGTRYIDTPTLNVTKGYYHILNNNNKFKTKINNPVTFEARPIWSNIPPGNYSTYNYDLESIGSKTTITNNSINDLTALYYSKLKSINSGLSNLSVRMINLRDLDDFTKFPCYSRRNGIDAKVRDDIDGDHGVTGFDCEGSDGYHWIYSPTAYVGYYGKYFTNILQVDAYKNAKAYIVSSTHYLDRVEYSHSSGDDFYNQHYFRPIIEISKTEYDSLPKV